MKRHALALLTAAALTPAPAPAQPPSPAPAAQPAPTTPAPPARPAPGAARPTPAPARDPKQRPREIELDDIIVRGEVQKPEVFYILQRSELNFKGQEPDKSFIPLIIESVDKDPF